MKSRVIWRCTMAVCNSVHFWFITCFLVVYVVIIRSCPKLWLNTIIFSCGIVLHVKSLLNTIYDRKYVAVAKHTSVTHQSWTIVRMSESLSCRLNAPSHSGSYSTCWLVWRVTPSIPCVKITLHFQQQLLYHDDSSYDGDDDETTSGRESRV